MVEIIERCFKIVIEFMIFLISSTVKILGKPFGLFILTKKSKSISFLRTSRKRNLTEARDCFIAEYENFRVCFK